MSTTRAPTSHSPPMAATQSAEGPPESAGPVVSARDVVAAYRASTVWAGATFDVAPGQFVAVLGPNGAGKSTLLRLVLGLLRPAAGSLHVLGGSPRRGNPAIGYVPQRRPIDPDMRLAGAQFVRLGVDGHRWGPGWPGQRADVARRITDAVDAVDAAGYVDHPVGTLSGGELQRLMLAQAIVNNPRLLLLDEPLANLDVRNQVGVATLVSTLARARGLAVLLVAHDVNPLIRLVDRVMYIAKGKVAVGRPDEVITSEHLSSLYGTNVEVLRDGRGRLFVVGLDDEVSHPHALDRDGDVADPC
ncbi:MAG: ATP-binding cassette domain-containing protein [Acidimicrobiia bacterium]|nr:ATP-binding cassette domain-containing protein [Acidimicrobiia bacterium]